MKCTACGNENLAGVEYCDACEVTLVHYKTEAPPPPEGSGAHRINDSIQRAGMRDPVLVKPSTSVRETLLQMKAKNLGCALVVDMARVVGIFTERDVLNRIAKPGFDLNGILVENVMTPTPEVLNETDPIAYALNKMAVGSYRHVPIHKADGTFAVFSVRDALKYFF